MRQSIKNIFLTYMRGDILIKMHADKNIPLILYIFALIALFITINLKIENTISIKVDNDKIIENLKIDYTHKSMELAGIDIRSGIDKMLVARKSRLEEPHTAPKRIR